MFIGSFVATAWQSNCYVVAPADSGDCLVIDVGIGAATQLYRACEDRDLTPVGVFATHGHIDHVGDAAEVANRFECPLFVHPADVALLEDPASVLGRSADVVRQLVGDGPLPQARDRRDLIDGESIEIAQLRVMTSWAPGHTPGSCLLTVSNDDDVITFTGDVLFAGSIGRTDFPRGSQIDMARSLSQVVLALPDDRVLLPGHGSTTTLGAERASNPYLQPAALEALRQSPKESV